MSLQEFIIRISTIDEPVFRIWELAIVVSAIGLTLTFLARFIDGKQG